MIIRCRNLSFLIVSLFFLLLSIGISNADLKIQDSTNGQCGSIIDSCNSGIAQNFRMNSTSNLWDCNGLNGGSNISSCSVLFDSVYVNKVFMIIFENQDYTTVMAQPYFSTVANNGSLFSNYYALVHPSQPNYIAITSGSLWNVTTDNNYDLNVINLATLFENYGISWKSYAENYPNNCFLGASSGYYWRKHEPFISYVNIQTNATLCSKIVDNSSFYADLNSNNFTRFTLYIPNALDDAHDTSASYADNWLNKTFGKLFNNRTFMQNTLVILTWDEDANDGHGNRISTIFYGPSVKPGFVSSIYYNHFGLVRTLEYIFGLPSMGQNDSTATLINDVWLPMQKINASCGPIANTCNPGNVQNITMNSTSNLWNCNGFYGGTNISCNLLFQDMYHPADINLNWELNDSEFTLYNRAYKLQQNWLNMSTPPSDNNYTRALYLYKMGMNYHYNSALQCPLCWVSG